MQGITSVFDSDGDKGFCGCHEVVCKKQAKWLWSFALQPKRNNTAQRLMPPQRMSRDEAKPL
jgi:hypothetical protein